MWKLADCSPKARANRNNTVNLFIFPHFNMLLQRSLFCIMAFLENMLGSVTSVPDLPWEEHFYYSAQVKVERIIDSKSWWWVFFSLSIMLSFCVPQIEFLFQQWQRRGKLYFLSNMPTWPSSHILYFIQCTHLSCGVYMLFFFHWV